MSTKQAPGEKPQIEGVREQRVTVFVVNAFLGNCGHLTILLALQYLNKSCSLNLIFFWF